MLRPLVLLCALGMPQGECTIASATDFWQAEPGRTPFQCLANGQVSASQYPANLLRGHYVKVRCERIPKN
jgi:hypothetical protein